MLSAAGFLLVKMPLTYSCLTQKQIDNFIKKENVSPIAIRNINNYTIILYETATEMAKYELTSDQFGRICMGKGSGNNNSDVVPVSVSSGRIYRQGAGSAEFVAVILNDKNIIENASTVKVFFDKGLEIIEQVNGHKGLIIPMDKDKSALIQSDKDDIKEFSNVIVFDKNGKELFNLKTSSDPLTFSTEDENFRVKTTINKLNFKKDEEINIFSTIEYIGNNESISIWSGDPYFHHTIYKGKECINGEITFTILKETILHKGELYTIPFSKNGGFDSNDPNAEFLKQYLAEKELKLPEGEYIFTAKTAFTMDQEQNEKVLLKNEFTVKVN